MKRLVFILVFMMLGMSVIAQQKIQLRSEDKAECVNSDMTSLRATFSFSTIVADDIATKGGEFAWLSMPNTVIGGNEGDPQIPVVNELIAVPVGSQPTITVTSYSIKDYNLTEMGIKTLVPRQPSLRKDKNPEDVPFVYNDAAYKKRGMRLEPQATVAVVGTMRGVQLGKLTIEPVSYDPVNNTLRVFNDIEVEVSFDGADAKATENMLVETYSPYFDIVYKQLFNGMAVLDAYTEHPDLYTTPVKMLVVTTSTYANSTAFQSWLTWKKQKGIYVDVQTVANNASANTIKNLIYARYNETHPTFLVLVGDETVVTYYQLWDYESNYGNAASDLEYASVDGDVYHDMYMSRMPVSSTTELSNLINKILTYEKYTMSDPSYLDETLLIAGWDSQATAYIGKPTIQYANNYYFNSAHGITPHVFLTTGSGQTTCYNYINNVGFVNYTAHGDIQKWHDPEFTNSNVNSLTNNDKYFWAMGNCCLTANFKNAQNNQTCFGEAMVRAANKGAWGYIGSVPESLWYEDYYFAVGATNTFGQMPTQAQTTTGVYDALFDDTGFNTLNAVPYIGNVAVTYAHAGNYQSSVDDEYYWRAYQCFGDGSVMPYLKVPAANNVSHAGTINVGQTSFTVNAAAGSYVSVTVDNEIVGVAQVPSSGTVDVPVNVSVPGTGMVVVTRNQRQPYIGAVSIVGTGTQYNITSLDAQHGTFTAPSQAWALSNVNLTATPAVGYELDSWVVFKTGDANTTVTVENNRFTMPEFDVSVCAIFKPVNSTQVSVGSGTGTTAGADLPTDVYYKYCLSQQIYTSEEVGDTGKITALSFYYNSSTNSGDRALAIYMSHTTNSTISSWITESTSHLVYSGNHNFTQGWNTITLDTPFVYNGTSNILLTVDDNTGTYYSISQFIYFYTYSTNANRAIYYRNDYTNPDPTGSVSVTANKVTYNAQLKMTKQVAGDEVFVKVISGYDGNDGKWCFISSPLAGVTSTSDVSSMTDNTFDLFRFNQNADMEWENWKTSGSHYHFGLESGRGYLYANNNDVILIFTGVPYSGNGHVSLVRAANVNLSGWNLIGNPFGVATTIGSRPFYRMNAAGNGEQVTFTSSKETADYDRIVLNLNNDEETIDRVIISIGDGGILPKYTMNDGSTKVYISQQGVDYAVVNSGHSDMLPVAFKTEQTGIYTLSTDVDKTKLEYLHLIDNLTGEDVDMLVEDKYSFIASPRDNENRFVVKFRYNANNSITSDEIFVYQNDSELIVNGEGELQIFDVMGRFVASYEINGNKRIDSEQFSDAVYIFRLIGNDVKTQKIVVK